MRTALIASALLALLALSAPALASDRYCKHEAPRQLTLDIGDARAVVFEVGPHHLTVESRVGAPAALDGRACSSHADRLPRLKIEQRRAGDKLVVRLYQDGNASVFSFGGKYAYLHLSATLPDHVPVQVKVGSGEAEVTGAPVLSADVGSGHAVGRDIRGLVAASVGSGEIDVHGAGSLNVVSIGSGEVEADKVRGATQVGGIGSGGFSLSGGGDVEIRSIGSGGAELRDINGNVTVGSVGSGGVDVRDVAGNLSVRSVGSGDVDHDGVKGKIDIPQRR
ncbi:hypothetical protein ASD77_13905 [Pseudoxanthomonas sp. Root65]|uniref:hypothetical protein n=1 Tax=Pseudoxanthomonas sp. Root65 TaxID=1736576 RepID=UPI0006FBA0A4|nr:hypothetical protein [Pseudoxanthomonas sp. Root65]KRA52713.1 hypothetical protein ASD77_13905 [Pseudoxanthomonas sp. Root65]